MFDIGWSELLLIAIVALIVVGPKDLPVMFRTLGRFTAKARAMGREFQRAMDDAARETGVKDTADQLRSMTSKKSLGLDALDKAATKFEKWSPTRPSDTPKGPATQALADKRAAETAARKDKATETAAAARPAPKPDPSGTASGTTAKPKPAAKPKAATPKAAAKAVAAKPAVGKTAKAKPAAKPRAKKGDA